MKTKVNKAKVVDHSILLFTVFPLLPNRVKGLPVIILLILGIVFFKKEEKVNWKRFFINSSLYFFYLLSLFVGETYGDARRELETGLSIFLIPLIFHVLIPWYRPSKELKKKFLTLFTISTSVFAFIVLTIVFFDNSTAYYSSWYTNKARTIITDIPIIGQHPIYASIFFSVSIIFNYQLIKIYSQNKFKEKLIYFLSILFHAFLLLLFLSKGVVIALLFATVMVLFWDSELGKKKYLLTLVILLILSSLLFFNRRMNELINFKVYEKVDANYSTGIRVEIYKCSFQVIKQSWLLGYGVGTSQKALNSCYSEKNNLLFQNDYNSHNQYLDIIIKTGIFGFVFFIYLLIINVSRAKRDENFVAVYIILFFATAFLTENILLRQSGVILFYFLMIFFNNPGYKRG